MLIEIGDTIKIGANLSEALEKYGFDRLQMASFCERFAGTEQTALDVYFDEENGTDTHWVIVDLCCEIPLECCKKV